MAIKRSKERIDKTGEIFTPAILVNEILDKLPQESFADSKKTFIDPACGDGNFLVEVLKRKLASNVDKLDALSSIYGIDIMEDNVLECRKRLLNLVGEDIIFSQVVQKNIICANTLEIDINTCFDT